MSVEERTAERTWIDTQARPAWQALRQRGDWTVLSAVARGRWNLRYLAGDNLKHLKATMEWLCRAQEATPDGGVAAAFDPVANRWYPSYPETTGYIIPTFIDYAAFSGSWAYRGRALRMADWLLSLQQENGAFPGPPWMEPAGEAMVFDTGQIIHGLVKVFEEIGERRFLDAAGRAGEWLESVQEADGSWARFDMGQAHVYNTRTAWALLRLDQAEGGRRFRTAARKNLDWALSRQAADGWFDCAAFEPGEDPLTHTLAYTIEGLLEAGALLGEERWNRAARLGADALRGIQEKEGELRGTYRAGWKSGVSWSCLTGNAQMAIIWMRLFELGGDAGYLRAAAKANRLLKEIQSRSSRSPGKRGGVAGSYPIYGDYGHYLYLNWAAKFFADSLMLEEKLETKRALDDGASA